MFSLKDFVSIPTYIVNDEHLSTCAKGLYAVITYMKQEHPDLLDTVLIQDIQKTFGTKSRNRKMIEKGLKELTENNYAQLTETEVTI